jgi:hypothetical protein
MIGLKVNLIRSPQTGIRNSKCDNNKLFCFSHRRYIVTINLLVTKKPKMSNQTAKDNGEESDMGVLDADSCMPIAIVGMGFRGPGDAQNVAKLEDMIRTGREAWSPVPAKRWNNTAFYHPDHSRHGTVGPQSP